MKPEEARIVSHICADGCLTTYVERNALQIVHGRRYHRPRKRYVIVYTNTDTGLLKEFSKDFWKIYGLKTRKRPNEVRAKSKWVFDRLRSLGAGGSYEWFVGKEFRHSNKSVKSTWLRAFFDDEATVDTKYRRIRVKNMNMKGLKQVRNLLKNLNIKSNITGPNCDKSWYLNVNHDFIRTFAKNVGFRHRKKNRLLKSLIKI